MLLNALKDDLILFVILMRCLSGTGKNTNPKKTIYTMPNVTNISAIVIIVVNPPG